MVAARCKQVVSEHRSTALELLRCPGPVVLYFHHVAARRENHYTSISSAQLEEILNLLIDVGQVVPILPLASQRSGPTQFVLTFDDGYSETIDAALPVLRAANCRATFFVISDGMGRRHSAPWGKRTLRASVSQLREVGAEGHTIASHSASHKRLDTMTPLEAVDDLARAQRLLENYQLENFLPGVVAYPFGQLPLVVPTWLRLGFATGRVPRVPWSQAPFRIRRDYLHSEGSRVTWRRAIHSWSKSWPL